MSKKGTQEEGFSTSAGVGASILNSLHSSPIDKFSILLIEPLNAIKERVVSSPFFLTPFYNFEEVLCHWQ